MAYSSGRITHAHFLTACVYITTSAIDVASYQKPSGYGLLVYQGSLQDCEGSDWIPFEAATIPMVNNDERLASFYWTHGSQPDNSSGTYFPDVYEFIISSIEQGIPGVTLFDDKRPFFPNLNHTGCISGSEVCRDTFYCLMKTLSDPHGVVEEAYSLYGDPTASNLFGSCLEANFSVTNDEEMSSSWGCIIHLVAQIRTAICANPDWDLTQANWDFQSTDMQLQTSLQGGVDSSGYYWPGGSSETPQLKPSDDKFGTWT